MNVTLFPNFLPTDKALQILTLALIKTVFLITTNTFLIISASSIGSKAKAYDGIQFKNENLGLQEKGVFEDFIQEIGNQFEALTTTKLRSLVIEQGWCTAPYDTSDPVHVIRFNRCAGRAFQTASLCALVLPENKKLYYSALRSDITGGERESVIPDAIGEVRGRISLFGLFNLSEYIFRETAFIEVKAVKSTLNMSHSRNQLSGMFDAIENNMFAEARRLGVEPVPTALFLVTTTDTAVGQDVIAQANLQGTALYQIPAFILKTDGSLFLGPNFPLSGATQLFASFANTPTPSPLGVAMHPFPLRQCSFNYQDYSDNGDPDPPEVQ